MIKLTAATVVEHARRVLWVQRRRLPDVANPVPAPASNLVPGIQLAPLSDFTGSGDEGAPPAQRGGRGGGRGARG
ncbi:hypothetical protein IMZ48_38625 [Candidatus Bathyarchaeota archaeon]|nr:hypothetical protein [Candidatus Bathyarchaeota archaeon]